MKIKVTSAQRNKVLADRLAKTSALDEDTGGGGLSAMRRESKTPAESLATHSSGMGWNFPATIVSCGGFMGMRGPVTGL